MVNRETKMLIRKAMELVTEKAIEGKSKEYLEGYTDGMKEGIAAILDTVRTIEEESNKLATSEEVISDFFSGLKIDKTSGNR